MFTSSQTNCIGGGGEATRTLIQLNELNHVGVKTPETIRADGKSSSVSWRHRQKTADRSSAHFYFSDVLLFFFNHIQQFQTVTVFLLRGSAIQRNQEEPLMEANKKGLTGCRRLKKKNRDHPPHNSLVHCDTQSRSVSENVIAEQKKKRELSSANAL